MRRRDFITLLGGAAASPLAAQAQQRPMPVIGFLHARSPEDFTAQLTALRRGLAGNGFVEGQSITIEYRWARGQYDQIPAMAEELVHLPAGLLVTGAEPSVLAAKAATSSIPIVFVVGTDPIKLGIVTSFNRPGGNATGVYILTTSLEAKRLGLLHELVPRADLIGVVLNPNNPAAQDQLTQLQGAASALGLPIKVLDASSPSEIDKAFDVVAREHVAALIVASDPFFDTRHEQIVALAARHAVPAMYQFRQYPAAGGLISYGIDLPDAYRQAGVYAGRILKGTHPNDLPVLEATKFELVINLKTAKALGIKISDNLMSLADEIIE
jgi:putative ABC transport system substrate-binding protein